MIHESVITVDMDKLAHELTEYYSPDSKLGVQSNGWSSQKYHESKAQGELNKVVQEVKVIINEIAKTENDLCYWITELQTGGEILGHDHNQSDWSAVYYLNDATDTDGGCIVFESGEVFAPVKGRLLVFPGTLNHYVEQYTGKDNRYSVVFNRICSNV